MNETFQNLPNEIDPEILKQILKDRKVMTEITRQSFFYFFYIYFGRYIKHPIAPFHYEMFRIGEDEKIKLAVIMTFRNSAKSAILNTAYALWSIMGIPQKKHVVIASQTQQRAKDHLMNIRKEIENNQLLSENLGPFEEREDRWHATTLMVPRYGVRITAISVEEGIRGLREGPYRPDLIIADDIEDSNSVKNQDGRDKTFDWFTGELLPLGDLNTKVIVLGNFLHQDSVLSRLEKMIVEERMKGVLLRVPLIDENNVIAWPGKFTSLEAIKELKQSIGNETVWQRDYLFKIIPDADSVIRPKWIHYYDKLPHSSNSLFMYTATGIDLAISKKESADYTAMVSAKVYGQGDDMRIYILPNPVNERMDSPKTLKTAKELSEKLGRGQRTELFIEDVMYQRSFIQNLQKENYPAIGVPTLGQDKRARLATVAPAVENGTVLFPKQGAEILINQLIGFGVEKHNDLADAFAILVGKIIEKNEPKPSPFPDQGNEGDDKPFFAGLLDREF